MEGPRPPSLMELVKAEIEGFVISNDINYEDVTRLEGCLLDQVLAILSPVALHKIHHQMLDLFKSGADVPIHFPSSLGSAWHSQYELRRPLLIEPVDWRQAYWEMHLQDCLVEPVLSSGGRRLGDIEIPDRILVYIRDQKNLTLGQNFQVYGRFLRSVRLEPVLCVKEFCDIVKNCPVENLSLGWLRTPEHIDVLRQVLAQFRNTLTSVEIRSCSLPPNDDVIFGSLNIVGSKSQGIEHLSVYSSTFFDTESVSLPRGLSSFLSSERLSSLRFSDSQLDWKFARQLFTVLLRAAPNLSTLDLSCNDITGWLSSFDWSPADASGGKCFKSLNVLNLRGTYLCERDISDLVYALLPRMHHLQVLNLGYNLIGDIEIGDLVIFFAGAAEDRPPLEELFLDGCYFTDSGARRLLMALSTLPNPLKSLSIAENWLYCRIASSIVPFVLSSIQELDISNVKLGPYGFCELQRSVPTELKLVKLDMSENSGEKYAAAFLSQLIRIAPNLIEVNAAHNSMPTESMALIEEALQVVAQGNLAQIDLRGNFLDGERPTRDRMLFRLVNVVYDNFNFEPEPDPPRN